jgi:hypothetical protein
MITESATSARAERAEKGVAPRAAEAKLPAKAAALPAAVAALRTTAAHLVRLAAVTAMVPEPRAKTMADAPAEQVPRRARRASLVRSPSRLLRSRCADVVLGVDAFRSGVRSLALADLRHLADRARGARERCSAPGPLLGGVVRGRVLIVAKLRAGVTCHAKSLRLKHAPDSQPRLLPLLPLLAGA